MSIFFVLIIKFILANCTGVIVIASHNSLIINKVGCVAHLFASVLLFFLPDFSDHTVLMFTCIKTLSLKLREKNNI